MSNLGKQIDVATLDFDQIKSNLINYFKNDENGRFSDWDFEGSNLNTIIDVLAYNTHYNAMLAHMAVNESFIDSAQLRSSVVSAAKLLGYIPRSRSASQITFDISIPRNPDITSWPLEISILGGLVNDTVSTVTAQNELNDHTFTLINDVVLTLNGNNYEATNVVAYEGSLITRTYAAIASDSSATYEIVDSNIDISTLKVRVFDSINTESNLLYQPFNSTSEVDNTTTVYFINENIFGKYEISFGDGIFGKKLESGNIIQLEYIITNGSAANNCSKFINQNLTVSKPNAIDIIKVNNALSLTLRSSGGQEKESVTALKNNAITSFSTQNRAVTSDDYANLIKAKFSYINSLSVWGGEDNIPPAYGKVFITANKIETNNQGYSSVTNLSPSDKVDILNYLKSKRVLSIFPEIIDSDICDIVLDILVKYNPNITTESRATIESQISNIIQNYNTNRVNEFNNIFRHSQFVRAIEDSSSSILNSLVRVYLAKSFDIKTNIINNITLNFGAECTINDNKVFVNITSDVPWILNNLQLYFNEEKTSDENIIKIYSYYLKNNVQIKFADIGTFNLKTGIMKLSSLYSDNDVKFTFIVNSLSNDIVAKRNSLLNINRDLSTIGIFADEIARGGNSRVIDYSPFPKDR
jgi:hypothetical protein